VTRRVLYLTGTRADFGLMLPTLQRLQATPEIALELGVTGMHLSPRFGLTVREVEASGLPIAVRIPAEIDDDSIGMGRGAAQIMAGVVALLAERKPDIVLLLGDRAEMLAGAFAAVLAGVPVFHLCGGERSGTIDDAMRHAISKLAHVHLVATEGSRERLLRMGEEASRIHVVGTPGLVGLAALATRSRSELAGEHGLDAGRPLALVLFHPVVQDAAIAGEQCRVLLQAVRDEGLQALCLMPNADSGNAQIRTAIEQACAAAPGFRAVTHLPRSDYASLLAVADVLVGNSSSGLIEAATFGTPVVNVGDRQQGRERNANVTDAEPVLPELRKAIAAARRRERRPMHNVYGDGDTDARVASILSSLRLDTALLKKAMTY
jgi:GDP/UDP-N,N'-diacetylbacillosamine 2-epimerase (hydrolysing)